MTYQAFAAAWPEKQNVVQDMTDLKQQAGQDILIYGSGILAQTLMQHDLNDEYCLSVYPVVPGSGQKLFTQTPLNLMLSETKTFSSGVILLCHA